MGAGRVAGHAAGDGADRAARHAAGHAAGRAVGRAAGGGAGCAARHGAGRPIGRAVGEAADHAHGHAAGAAGHEGVDVVAADPPEQGGEAACDLVRFAGAQRAHASDQIRMVAVSGDPREVPRHLAEPDRAPARKNRADRVHVVHHVAVADGARAARVVAGHASDGGPVGGRDVDGEEEPFRLQPTR